ncbi:Uncharacterised protein [Klebsiella pneumoniae]|uniref:Uncharacterized protein n=1 Tax=Klebsiella pneumoniae TaxID=573 RepID=A0A3S4H8Y1_KLEPN|nr:Uncharacterised protein [Klebsiella pneumoniae]
MKCTGSGRGRRTNCRPVHRSLITVCMARVAPTDGIHRTGLDTLWYSQCSSARQLPRGMRAGSASCASPSTGCGSTFSKAAIFNITASPPGAQRFYFLTLYADCFRIGATPRGTRTAHTGSAAIAHQFFPPPGRPAPRNDAEAYPSIKPKISPNRLMADHGYPDCAHYNFTKPLKAHEGQRH